MKLSSLSPFLNPIEIRENSSYLAGIDCIYAINLEERKDRLQGLFSLLQEHGLQANRVKAVNGWLLSDTIQKDLEIPSYSTPLTKGEIGCFLSHLSVWKDALERGFTRVWVVEDDIHFRRSPSELEPLLEELQELDPEWDLLYTDSQQFFCVSPRHTHLLENAPSNKEERITSLNLIPIQGRLGLHSLILSKQGLYKIMQYIEQSPIFGPIDYQIHFVPGLKKYGSSSDIVSVGERYYESDTTTQPCVIP